MGIVAVAVLAAIAALATARIAAQRDRATLSRAKAEMNAGRYALARERLLALGARSTTVAEVQFLLGECELARGRPDAALESWSKIPGSSPFAAPAALRAADVLMRAGQFSALEARLQLALRSPAPEVIEARHLFFLVLGQQGRVDEARDWIERLWCEIPRERRDERVALVKEHLALDLETFPLEGNATVLGGAAPRSEDDRAWLAHAYLDLRRGRFDDAEAWLEKCKRRRPGDAVVAFVVLEWAMAANCPAAAARAMPHLAPRYWSEPRYLIVRAWLARQRGDRAGEAALLDRLIVVSPGDTQAIARRADLAAQAGDPDGSRGLLRRLAELDEAKDRYRRLLKADRIIDDAREMARLAERLGRRFEASALLDLVPSAGTGPRAGFARADAEVPLSQQARESFARQVADELAALGPSGSCPRAASDTIPRFDDSSRALGLSQFVFDNGASAAHQLPEVASGGIGLLDYDGDGWLDVYAVQGGAFPGDPARPYTGDRLFRNRRDGTFEDVSASSGVAALRRGYGHGVAAADFDNDGHTDLFVMRWRAYALYRNRGDGTFEDVTEQAGLGGDRDWPTSAAFGDFDGDGDLDLYVCHYGAWDAAHPRLCKDPSGTFNISCDPRVIAALPDHLFRNDRGRFTDVTREAGIVDADGRGLGVVSADLDGDGRLDLVVANDSTANYFFRNRGGFRFEEVGHSSGLAANAQGGYQAGMGVACADLDGDGRLDVLVTNFYDEGTTFYHNLGDGLFADRSAAAGLAAASRFRLGFGIVALDANNDGRLDLLTANGHVNDLRPMFPFAMPPQLFIGTAGGRLVDVTRQAGPPFQSDYVGRGLAAGDLDNDGRPDAVMVAQNDPLVVFRNQTSRPGHYITLQLEGTRGNRDGIGAMVTVVAGERRQAAQRCGGGSYQSASDPRLHFGLGDATRVDAVEVRWPSGATDRYAAVDADAAYRLREGERTARLLWLSAATHGAREHGRP